MSQALTLKQLKAEWINSEQFKPYGQVISASVDGKPFDQEDAQLHLDNGIPRFYIMRLEQKGRQFNRITRHQHCTQCLGSLEGKDWLMAVAPPSLSDEPNLNKLAAFRIPGNCFIKLEVGTWHAGPYFEHEYVDFYNLELSDTNIVDHFTHDFSQSHRLNFEIVI
ncbi:MAG: ureidoglycolate lyase [Microcoleaceae cyanobacterium]